MSDNLFNTIIALALVISFLDKRKKKRKQRFWANERLQKRNKYNCGNLLPELRLNQPEDYRIFLRMNEHAMMNF
jgi:hypothetical protein